MKYVFYTIIAALIAACNNTTYHQEAPFENNSGLQGTWKLISGTTIEKNDTVVTDYLKSKSFIKIITAAHFAFLGHDLSGGKDSSATFFSSGGGSYELNGNNYTEHLEYCNAREWEGHEFQFKIAVVNDTLVQQGVEKIDSLGVNRINIEKYVRIEE